MYQDNIINDMLLDFSRQIKAAFADKLCDIVLFGSYARGDFDAESDIDIAILADVSREDEHKYSREIVRITESIYDVYGYSHVLSPVIINSHTYNEWKDYLPFYKNVATEGVRIVA